MKQLEMSNFGVLEMQQEEMRETDGGWAFVYNVAAGLVAWYLIESVNDAEANKKAFNAGRNSVTKY